MPTRYLREGTSVTAVTVDDGMSFPDPPAGAVVIDKAEYDTIHSEIKAAVAEKREAVEAEDTERTRGDYEALLGAGLPEATARRLSGFQGEGAL